MKKIIIMLIAFIGLVALIYYFNEKQTIRNNELLRNNIFFKGHVLNLKVSNNHTFGIILLHLDSTNVKYFSSSLKNGIYPYRIKNGKAEIYNFIPDGIGVGDEVTVQSNALKILYHYLKSNLHYEDTLEIITDGVNIDYVKKNTNFK